MAGITVKRFARPDETRTFTDKGRAEILKFADGAVGRAVFEPGWKWSIHVKPIAATRSCQTAHSGYCVSGRMHVVMDDGEEAEFGPGDYAVIEPGHDAWTVGREPCVFVDFAGMENYARPSGERRDASGEESRPGMH
jgi:mannose-6-phosphate isomerase-like protein (cupin superfamily)